MTATTKVPLGPATLNRKWYLDVNTGTYGSPIWTGVFGIEDFKAPKNPNLAEDSDFDSEGWESQTVTAMAWVIDLKVGRKVQASDSTAYDDGQEKLRTLSDLMGVGNTADVRWYEMEDDGPRVEAYRGFATVSWVPDGGDMKALDTVTVTLTGKGKRTSITHPDSGTAVPVTYSVSPATGPAAGGTLVRVVGSRFFKDGVNDVAVSAGVKFDSTAAPSWLVDSDGVLHAVAPAHAAGIINVKVTNSVGASTVMATYEYTT